MVIQSIMYAWQEINGCFIIIISFSISNKVKVTPVSQSCWMMFLAALYDHALLIALHVHLVTTVLIIKMSLLNAVRILSLLIVTLLPRSLVLLIHRWLTHPFACSLA